MLIFVHFVHLVHYTTKINTINQTITTKHWKTKFRTLIVHFCSFAPKNKAKTTIFIQKHTQITHIFDQSAQFQ